MVGEWRVRDPSLCLHEDIQVYGLARPLHRMRRENVPRSVSQSAVSLAEPEISVQARRLEQYIVGWGRAEAEGVGVGQHQSLPVPSRAAGGRGHGTGQLDRRGRGLGERVQSLAQRDVLTDGHVLGTADRIFVTRLCHVRLAGGGLCQTEESQERPNIRLVRQSQGPN